MQLYLASDEPDSTDSGRVNMQNVRGMMHGLSSDVAVMYRLCTQHHNHPPAPASESQLHTSPDGLSEQQFVDKDKLSVWPGECHSLA